MNNYIDIYGRYHNQPVTEDNPIPSNNGWIYTAYCEKAGLPVDMNEVGKCFNLCRVDSETLLRSPGISTPPISRDELLGMVSLGVLKPKKLAWNFSPYPIPKFSLLQLFKQLWQLKGQNRNYFWQNNLDQIYRFAFSVPLSDRHFILKKWGKFKLYNPVHLFYAAFGKINSKLNVNALDWLKYDEKKGLNALRQEFPEDHPIVSKLGL